MENIITKNCVEIVCCELKCTAIAIIELFENELQK